MVPITWLFTLATSPVAKWLGAGLALAAAIGGAYLAIDARAVARCERDHALAVIHAQEEAHQANLAAIERGDRLAAELAQTQRRLDAKQKEYLAYAYGITGNCDPALGVLASAASRGEALLPEAARPSLDAAPPVSAAAIGANLAENYSRCFANAAQLRALIEWHHGTEALK